MGAGKIVINTRPVETYFARPVLRMMIQQPLVAANRQGQFHVVCTVSGGGLAGQAGAVRHGISKALMRHEPDLRACAQARQLVTSNSRVVERKKYGKAKARKAPVLEAVIVVASQQGRAKSRGAMSNTCMFIYWLSSMLIEAALQAAIGWVADGGFWHIAALRCHAAIRRLSRHGGLWRGVSPADLWVHGPMLIQSPHHRRGLAEQELALFVGADRGLAEIRIDLLGQRIGAHAWPAARGWPRASA